MEFLKIVLFSLAAAIAYGVLHDSVTANICVEYFTIAHPLIVPTQSPFVLAMVWGVVATWWLGLPLGLMLAVAARAGPPRRLALATLRPWILRLLAVMAASAFVAGAAGALLFGAGLVPVPGNWAAVIPADKHLAFTAVAWAHFASYISGAIGAFFIIAYALASRIFPGRYSSS